MKQIGLCQSPSHRGTHFYSRVRVLQDSRHVSIPFTPGNSFLQNVRGTQHRPRMCQSPSHRGTHFYPYTLFFVDFMRLSSLDFRGIFQTILKTAVFSVTSTFLSIFYKRAYSEGHAFLQILVFSAYPDSFFQTYGFISATQYDRRSTLLTPCGFYSGDLLSLPRCIQQTYVQCMLVVRVFPPIRITLSLSSRKCRPRHKPRLSHPAIRAAACLTQNPELRQCSAPLLPTGI